VLQGEELLVLPLVVMGMLLVTGGACSLLLPETLNQHLPQSLEDGEKFGKEWSWRNLAACCPSRYWLRTVSCGRPLLLHGTTRMFTKDSSANNI
jgi:hypothetical protein